ncbi:thiamine-phosphate kinase [Methylomonas sp. HYX-M1]|uniref:thiamine-phosphate kinase n=1 Tax=Methylomonas sp. HYX-M1 TaxID=3139307 RepID=UPI00345BF680
MALAEFDLIQRYFAKYAPQQAQNRLGIGDDCALLSLPVGHQLAVTTDTMVENVHFFADVDPTALGHKLLAVNLSDLAAMGAHPFAVTLSLTLPHTDEAWLQAFADGFIGLAKQQGVDLIGGDTTAGPLTLSVTAMGSLPQGGALLRSAAKVGDLIYVSGQVGNAGLGLKIKQGWACSEPDLPLRAMDKPHPRIAEGLALRGVAHACIDISDGLAADLGHILDRSEVGACLEWERVPLSAPVQEYIRLTGDWRMPLIAGDDYELCFTVPAKRGDLVPAGCYCIGVIQAEPGLRIRRAGREETIAAKGYEHFF